MAQRIQMKCIIITWNRYTEFGHRQQCIDATGNMHFMSSNPNYAAENNEKPTAAEGHDGVYLLIMCICSK